jgi:hypothetical protein
VALADFFRDLAQQMLTPGGIFEDVPIEATYTRMSNPLYDPVTGIVTEAPTAYPVTGVKDQVNYRSVDNVNVLANDELFYVAGKALKDVGLLVPSKPDDTLTFLGERWNVVGTRTDPVNAVIIIQIRRP